MNNAKLTLGVNVGFHDASACITRDGVLLAFVEQERLSRRRHAVAQSPAAAVAACLERVGATPDDIGTVALGWDFAGTPMARNKRFTPEGLMDLLFGDARPATPPPIEWVKHHVAHAASAFYAAGVDEAAVLVLDGAGESQATSLYHATGTSLTLVQEWPVWESLGFFYTAATKWAGFGDWGPGKFMGLAAYGRDLGGLPLAPTPDGYHIELGAGTELGADGKEALIGQYPAFENAVRGSFEQFFPYRERHGEGAMAYGDLAHSVQAGLEAAVLSLASHARAATGCSTVVLAGGVALNCSMTGHLVRSGIFDDIYVPPVPTDSGVALGAAFEVDSRRPTFAPTTIDHPYWSTAEIDTPSAESALATLELPHLWVGPHGVAAATAKALEAGKMVAWARGRAEIGERSLGARSMLADPRTRDSVERLNEIKDREMWRPVAPSILEEHVDEIFQFDVGAPARFMLAAGIVRPDRRTDVPAITHVDGTARPQTVSKASNPAYWEAIDRFRVATGVPLVCNTSLNIAGEPIVGSAAEALDTFERAPGLDVLILDDAVVTRDPETLHEIVAATEALAAV